MHSSLWQHDFSIDCVEFDPHPCIALGCNHDPVKDNCDGVGWEYTVTYRWYTYNNLCEHGKNTVGAFNSIEEAMEDFLRHKDQWERKED